MSCDIDDFCKPFAPLYHQHLLQAGCRHRRRQTALALSESMTILVYFHSSHYRSCKSYYPAYVEAHLRPDFPQLGCSQRFGEWMPRALVPRCGSVQTRKGRCTGIAFVASTPLVVGPKRRIATHKVFDGWATRGKTSMGWLYGFQLHLMVKDVGELWAFCLPPGHGDARRPVPKRAPGLCGQLFGDRGSISQALHDALWAHGLELVTKIRKNMKHRLRRLWDTLLLRKRALMETINDPLTNISQIAHTRHRRVTGCMINMVAGLGAYSDQPKKPSLGRRRDPLLPVLIV
jgi:hypothetical protein